MLENARTQLDHYKVVLVYLCKHYPHDANKFKLMYMGKIDGVCDMLAYDKTISLEEYPVIVAELKESFEREVNDMLK